MTALWNTNAFFAYVFACLISGVKWDIRRLVAVLIATTGALVVVYGESSVAVDESGSSSHQSTERSSREGAKAPLVGDLLTLAASIIYGAYQVLYKMYAALPNDPEVQTDGHYAPLAASPEEMGGSVEDGPTSPLLDNEEITDPPPFGLYPNMLTSAIGVCTFLTLWIPIPVLHFLDIERFALPHRAITYVVIAGIALSGSIFNAGFMVSLSPWEVRNMRNSCFRLSGPHGCMGTHRDLGGESAHHRARVHIRRHLRRRSGHSHDLEHPWV